MLHNYFVRSTKIFQFLITPDELRSVLNDVHFVVANTGVTKDYTESDPSVFLNKYEALYTMFQNQDYKTMSETLSLNKRLYEKDSDGYVFPWNIESYYYDNTKMWLIYVSHEGTITFSGEKIVDIAKKYIDNKYQYQ